MLKRLLMFAIKIYKKYFSSSVYTNCCFKPTCSEYALEALQKHGLIKGCGLAVYRILRCNGLSKGGLDPVPDSFKVKKWLI